MAKKGGTITLWRRSFIMMLLIVVLGFGAVLSRLLYLQVTMAEELQKGAVEQQLNDTTISARRGSIYDCSGTLLAQSVTVWDVVLQPANFKNDKQREAVSKGLSEILGVEYDWLKEKTKEYSFYVVIKRKIDNDLRSKVLEFSEKIANDKENPVSGVITLIENYSRKYTYDNFAGDVLGFVGSDNQGLAGIEYEYDDYLTGTPGKLVVARDPYGADMPYQYEQKVDATDGYNLILTIDEKIQSIMEKYVRETIDEFNVANRGVAIMMNVKTGAILGLACEGSFNNNDPFTVADEKVIESIHALPEAERPAAEQKALESQWRNKAVSDTYVPGSVFKMVTASSVLSEGLIKESTKFECDGAYSPVEGMDEIDCWNTSGHGTQTIAEALCNSCNPAFMQMGFMLGREKFYEYYVAFGFSEKTGIDLPGESEDVFFQNDGVHGMGLADLAVASFGQNFKITPIQMLTACAAIANDGKLVKPYVVSQVVDGSGNVVKSAQTTIKRQVISEDVAHQICEMLERNVVSGGATNGYVAGYRIGAKTGTSQKKVDEYGNATNDYIASFCGIAPCDDPEIALLCFFDTPDPNINYYGSGVAGPCFRNIMSEVLPYLGVEKIYADVDQNLETTVGLYTLMTIKDAQAQVEKDGLKAKIVGEGKTVIAQNPAAYSSIPKDGTVVLYTDADSQKTTVTVPDFTGRSLADANYYAAEYSLNINIIGSVSEDGETYVKSQDIKAGTEVKPYTVITITFNQDNSIM